MSLFLVIFLPFLHLPGIGKGYRQLAWGPPITPRTRPTTWRPSRTPRTQPTTWRPPSKYDFISFDVLLVSIGNIIHVHKEKYILNLEYKF